MTTQRLTRDWRLPTAGLMLLAILFAGFTLHAHWNAFIQWCLATQITLHRYLVMYLLQLNNHQYSGGLWLLTGAFLYGVLHAIGPGHGKFIVTTYLTTNKESELAARVVPLLGSLMQGVSAILFVFILAVGFNLASGDISTSRWYVEKVSAVLIGAFGAFVIYQALKSLRPRRMSVSAIKPLHQHDEHCGCGHHGVGADLTQGDWKTRLGVILAIGARPCSGAIMILMFSNALGIVTWGMAAVMTMSLGTALSIMGLSLAPVTHADSGWQPVQETIRKSEKDTRQYQAIRLDNGMTVLLVSDPQAVKSLSALVVPVGSLEDPDTHPGLAHYLEHMTLMGSKKYPQPDSLSEFLKMHGGSHNASTAPYRTAFYLEVENDALEGAVDRLADSIAAPLLDKKYADRERNAVNAELTMARTRDGMRMAQVSAETKIGRASCRERV